MIIKENLSIIFVLVICLLCSGCCSEFIMYDILGVPIDFSLDSYFAKKFFSANDINYIVKWAGKKKWDIGYNGTIITVKETFVQRPQEEIVKDIQRWLEGFVQDDIDRVERQKGTKQEAKAYTTMEVIVQLQNKKKIGRGVWTRESQKINVKLFL